MADPNDDDENNIVYDNSGTGITMGTHHTNVMISNNLVLGNGD